MQECDGVAVAPHTRAELERRVADPELPYRARIDAAEELLAGCWAQSWGEDGEEAAA